MTTSKPVELGTATDETKDSGPHVKDHPDAAEGNIPL
jgi:hypothetical protein